MSREVERRVVDATLQLDCVIGGNAPVQADGSVLGHPLYFHARWSGWSFTVATHDDVDPSALTPGDAPGFFRDGAHAGWATWGTWGDDADASWMPYDVAEDLIRRCAAELARALGRR